MSHLVTIIHEHNGSYGVSFPDLPGCISQGDSFDEAMVNGADAVAFHIEGMIEDGETIPVPRTLDALRKDPEFKADFKDATLIALTPLIVPGRSVRVNLTFEENLLEAIDKAAKSIGATRSGFLAEAAKAKISAR